MATSNVPEVIVPSHQETRAIYAGSFDPITLGHLHVIEQAVTAFDHVDVMVAVNPEKANKGRFPYEERLTMIGESVSHLGRVGVGHIENEFVVKYAQRNGYTHLVRGIRNTDDFLKEQAMRDINRDMAPDIKTIFLMCDPELASISSSAVMQMVGPEGWETVVNKYVPGFVFGAIKKQRERALA